MSTTKRVPFPQDLRTKIMETAQLAASAECSPDEIIELCKATIKQWQRDNPIAAAGWNVQAAVSFVNSAVFVNTALFAAVLSY